MSEATVPTQQAPRPPLRGWPLLIVRIIWSALAVLVITVFVASVIAHFNHEVLQITVSEALAQQIIQDSGRRDEE